LPEYYEKLEDLFMADIEIIWCLWCKAETNAYSWAIHKL